MIDGGVPGGKRRIVYPERRRTYNPPRTKLKSRTCDCGTCKKCKNRASRRRYYWANLASGL